MATGFEKKVYVACSKIKRGRVSTYSEIATAIGRPKAVRAVGNALNKNRDVKVPCHRVVRSDGKIGGFVRGEKQKARFLKGEGVEASGGKVRDFKRRFQGISQTS